MARLLTGMRLCLLLLLLSAASLFGCQALFGDVEIGDPPPEDPDGPGGEECTVGDFRCYRENLLTCKSKEAGWVTISTCTTADFCDSRNERCRVCKDGDFRCNDAVREACNLDGSGWMAAETCTSADLCSPTTCGPCTPGAVQCSGTAGNVLRQCNANHVWADLDTCLNAGLCEKSRLAAQSDPNWSKTCEAPACSLDAPHKCDGANLLKCSQDQAQWVTDQVCSTAEVCEKSAAAANEQASTGGDSSFAMCLEGCSTPGGYFCSGMNLLRCRDDRTMYDPVTTCAADTECNPVQGQCSPLCTPGEYQCNAEELRRCTDKQTWERVQGCATAALCTPAPNGCQEPKCPTAGEYRCLGAELQECSRDQTEWISHGLCQSEALCDAAGLRCELPTCPVAGELRCDGQELKECDASLTKWIPPLGRTEPLVCPAGQFCDKDQPNPGCKTECTSTKRCNGRVLETCSAERGWQTDATCQTAELCQCTLQDPDAGGPLTNSCAGGLTPDAKCGAPVCATGEYRCTGAKLERCLPSRTGWETAATCESAALCYAGNLATSVAGYCAVCTMPYEIQCVGSAPGSTLRQCTSDRKSWMTIQTCTAYSCIENGTADYCATCNIGDAQCSGKNLQKCASDRRSFSNEMCLSAALCDQRNKQCDVCTPGVTCVGKELQTCSADGQTLTKQTCANGCDMAAGKCDSCVAGDVWCSGVTMNLCSADGQSQTTKTCLTKELCALGVADKQCGAPACAVGQRQCTATGQPQVCNAGRTGYTDDGLPCVTPELCMGGTCSPPVCMVGDHKCSMAQPQVCNAGRTAFISDGPACATPELCVGTATTKCTAPACAAGEHRCNLAQPQVCNDGRTAFISDGPACATPELCVGTATTKCTAPACAAGEHKCSGAQPQVCNDGRTAFVSDGPACATAELCVGTATTTCTAPACAAGEHQCSGAQPQVCNAGRTAFVNDGPACASAALCVGTATVKCNTAGTGGEGGEGGGTGGSGGTGGT